MSGVLNAWADGITSYLLAASLAALVLVPLAAVLLRAARVRTAVYRHMIWLHCLAGIVLLPLLWLHLPKLTLAILPARVAVPTTSLAEPPRAEPVARSQNRASEPVSREPAARVTSHETRAATQAFPVKPLLAAVWLVGFGFMLARLGLGWHRLQRIAAQATPVHPLRLPESRGGVRVTSAVRGPACLGILRPVILLPRDMYETATPQELRMVLTHELAHVRRRDGCLNLFQRLIEAAFFFHPLVWLASRQLTNEREHICDNYVLAQGVSPDDYTTLLFRMVEQVLDERRLPRVALVEGQLLARVRSLLNPRRSRRTRLPWRVAAACTAVVFAVFLVFGSIRLAAKPAQAGPAGERATPQARMVQQVRPPFTFTIKTITREGQPQAGVKVRCVHPRPERGKALVDMTVTSNESGVATFVVQDANVVTDRYFWFRVADAGFAGSGGVGISPIDHELEWTFKTLPVQGRRLRIVNEQGAGAAGAKVWLHAAEVSLGASANICDNEGNVTVKCPQARLAIAALAPGYAANVIEEVELTGPDPYVIQLHPGQEIRGQILDSRNRPVPGMVVRAQKQAPFHRQEELIPQGRTGVDGRFTLAHVSRGDWEITARSASPDQPLFVPPVTVFVADGKNPQDISLAAQEGFRIKGKYVTRYNTRLRFEGGKHPIFVWVAPPRRAVWEEQTHEDGTFDLWGLPCQETGEVDFIGVSGFHQVIRMPRTHPFLQVDGRRLRFESVPPGTYEGIEVHFVLAGHIHGTVTDASGNPLRDVEVIVNPPGYIVQVNEKGEFTSEAAPGENVTVTVRKRQDPQRPPAQEAQEDRVLLVGEPFTVQEGEIVERKLVVAGSAYGGGPSQVGRRTPALDTLGANVRPDVLSGKRILLCFFDMNQRPSRRLVPELAARAKDLQTNNVVTLSVHAGDADPNAVQQWLRERGVPFPAGTVAGDPTKLARDWTVQALPWLVLLDEKRTIQATGFNLAQLDENLKGKSLERLPMALDWRAKFDLVYHLDEGQILKRVAPPFIPERQKYYTTEHETQASLISETPDRFIFHWDGGLRNWGLSFGDKGSLDSTLSFVSGLKSYEYEGQEELLKLELPGDWIIRDEAAIESKLKALEQLLAAELGRSIRFEKRSVEQEVIVATGRYELHPLPGAARNDRVIMCTDEADHAGREGGGGGTADSVRQFVEAVGNRVGIPVADQTEPAEPVQIGYNHHSSSYLTRVKDPAEKANKLKVLLESLSQQTSLHFQIERRAAEKWFVVEDKPGPASSP